MNRQGLDILESKVDLPEPIKSLGVFEVPVTLSTGDIVPMTVTVIKR